MEYILLYFLSFWKIILRPTDFFIIESFWTHPYLKKKKEKISGKWKYVVGLNKNKQIKQWNKQIKKKFLAGALGNVEYPFIAIAPRPILAWSSSTW